MDTNRMYGQGQNGLVQGQMGWNQGQSGQGQYGQGASYGQGSPVGSQGHESHAVSGYGQSSNLGQGYQSSMGMGSQGNGGMSYGEGSPLQGRYGEQGRFGSEQGRFGSEQGRFGSEQGRFGGEQGRFGSEQGRFSGEQGRFGGEQDRFGQSGQTFGREGQQGHFGRDRGFQGRDQPWQGQQQGQQPWQNQQQPWQNQQQPWQNQQQPWQQQSQQQPWQNQQQPWQNQQPGQQQSWQGQQGNRDFRRPIWQREPMSVQDIMTQNVKTATPKTSVKDVAQLMKDENVGIIPVVDDNRKLLGVVTDRDLVVRLLAQGKDIQSAKLEDVMTDDIEAVTTEESLRDVIDLMGDKQIRRVPVVDKNDRLVGIISLADLALRADQDEDLQDALMKISSKRSFWSRLSG